jgi:hypothetical protein
MAVLTSVMTSSMSFATVDLGALDEKDDADNNSGYDTFLDDGTNSAYSGFPADDQETDRFGSGIPTSDELIHKYGIDGVDGATAGPPQDELNAASTPEQGESASTPEQGESASTPEQGESASTPEQGESSDSEREGNLPDKEEAAVTGGNDNTEDETKSDSTAYKKFLGCLSDAESGDGSTTEQEVQDCNESSYGGEENSQPTPIENTGEGTDQGGISGDRPTDDKKIPNGELQTDMAD